MARQTPPRPSVWEGVREANAAARQAAPGVQPDRAVLRDGRRFRVIGSRAVFGIEPGQVGTLSISAPEVAALIEAGHIAPVDNKPGHRPNQERE